MKRDYSWLLLIAAIALLVAVEIAAHMRPMLPEGSI